MYVPAGFTPDEEKQILAAEKEEGQKVDKIVSILEKQDQVRIITTVAVVSGLIFTLARFGDLVATMRARRRGES